MFIRSNFAERRKYNRFKVAEGAFAKFHKPRLFKLIKPRIVKSAPIIDISLEGLAFQYTDRTMWSPNFNELSISKAAVDVKIDNVPFKAISDFLASRFSDSTLIRRCGVKFGKLTPSEKLKEVADKYNTLFAPSTTPENHCAIYTFALVLRNNGDALICPDAEEQRGLFGNVRERSMKEIAQRVCIE